MEVIDESSERLVCAVLAAQTAALRDCMDTSTTIELLFRTTDVLSQLSGLVRELSKRHPALDPGLDEQCVAAVAAEADITRLLSDLTFLQAQRHDVTRQMADCVVTALERLSAADAPAGARLSPHELAELYVCEDQREVHDAVTRRFGADASSDAARRHDGRTRREGTGT